MTVHPAYRQATSAYEVWVRRLRQWQREPTTPLHDLPTLEHETFTPTTYQRLMVHIEKALESVTQRWSERLTEAFNRGSGHDLARDLVALRPLLARRVQLAHHPRLPPALRDALRGECKETLTRLQSELEKNIDDLAREGRLSRTETDNLLRTVRENSLLRIVDMEISQDGTTPHARAVEGEVASGGRASGGRHG